MRGGRDAAGKRGLITRPAGSGDRYLNASDTAATTTTTDAAATPRPRSMCDGREWKTVGFSFRISDGSSGGDAHAGSVEGVKLTNNKRQTYK